MAKRQYIIYCDESDKKGQFYTNFYGGALIRASDREALEGLLNSKKQELNLGKELKWQRVSSNYLEFISYYFDFVQTGRIKVRIMFKQKLYIATGLTKEQIDDEYLRLYYQFIKHSFGIKYSNPNALDRVYFTLLIDDMPDNKEKISQFKEKISSIPETPGMRGNQLYIPYDQISEIDSDNHIILQGLDIILGAMCSRLNNKFLIKPEGKHRRGKRTIARDKLYKHINSKIREIYPGFNVGISTGTPSGLSDRWTHPYRHWRFVPTNHIKDPSYVSKKAPPEPT